MSPKRHTEAVQHSSKDPCWRTPTQLFAALDQEFHFLVDAAAEKTNKLCGHYFGPDHVEPTLRDALQVDWAHYVDDQYDVGLTPFPRRTVFINMPYSKELANAYRTGKIKIDNTWHPHELDPQKALAFEVGNWTRKCWEESQKGLTIVAVVPFSHQTIWWKRDVEGLDPEGGLLKHFHAAREVRKIPHRVPFLRPDGSVEGNAGGNTAIVVWKPKMGIQAPWVPWTPYWEYEE